MSTFFEKAKPLAERGLRCFPLIKGQKRPVKLADGNHFDHATTDEEQLEYWSKQQPDANVGIIPDEHHCYLETDSETELKELAAAAGIPDDVWNTTRVSSGRTDRCYFIFRQTQRTRDAGDITGKSRLTTDNLFELKVFHTYIVGPGSIHPVTKLPYVAEWRNQPALPTVLLNLLLELHGGPGAAKARGKQEMDAETQRQTALLDSFCEMYEVATTGDWFSKGKQWFRPIVCPWEAEHTNASGPDSTCIVYNVGGGFGFKCQHRCVTKGWKDFRAAVQSRFPDRQFSFVESPGVVIGSAGVGRGSPEDGVIPPEVQSAYDDASEEVEDVTAGERARYPMDAWEGTLIGEYSELCGAGNFIPRKFFAEAVLSHIRAIVGTQVQSRVGGAMSHAFTLIISPTNSGKGVSIEERPNLLFNGSLTAARHLLWNADDAVNRRASSIGAELRVPATAQGFMTDFDPTGKRAKRSDVLGKWKGIPRIFLRMEEMGELLGSMQDEQTGRALGSMLNKLFDRYDFQGTSTTKRVAFSGQMVLNILGGITRPEWDDIMQNCKTARTGFFNRLTIIGSEQCRRTILRLPDLTDFRRRLLDKLHTLDDDAVFLDIDPKASDALLQWMESTEAAHPNDPDLLARFNVHVLRPALMRAWLLGHKAIELGDILACIPLGDFQLKMREFYFPQEGESKYAQAENLLLHTAKMRGRITKRELFKVTDAYRKYGTQLAKQAFTNLLSRRALRVEKDIKKTLRVWVIALKDKGL